MAFENIKSTGIAYVLTKLKDYFLQIKDAVKSVNGELPDEDGDITIRTVPFAQNLESESSHRNYDVFTQRTTGGDSSVDNGEAWLMSIKGNNDHTGYVEEVLDMTVTALGDEPITATIDRDEFVAAVDTSGTTTLVYSTSWSANPEDYGVTVTGTPVVGDTITIVYVKEERGTITVATPETFVSTGWNLYDHAEGYAKVIKYDYGYRVAGTYTALKFSTTITGTKTDIIVNDGNFDITSDGYVFVTGGNDTDTAIFATWEDWTDTYDGSFEPYSSTVVDLSDIMDSKFPYGLLKAGGTVDEIDLNLGQAISRVERMTYSDENLATAKASGREYEYDENYIYLAKASAQTESITIDGGYIANDHGIEYFTGTDIDIDTELLYGNNLKNKLERDVLTISSQELTTDQQNQVRDNIASASTIYLTSSDNTWSLIYQKISFLPLGKPATIYVNSYAIGSLTGSAFTSGTWSGTITRSSSGIFELMLKSNNNVIIGGHIASATSSSSGTFTFRNYGEVPSYFSFGISSGANSFTITNGTMMEIAFFAAASARRGKSLVYASNGTVYHDDSLGSSLEITTSTNTLTITPTGGGCTMQCTVYAGSITVST